MLTDTQRLFMGSYRSDYAVGRISEFLDKSGKALMSLFSPEDTTENEGGGQLSTVKHNANIVNGLTKAVFWITLSISIALQMGRLS